ncbi:MAG: hypothetical protein KGI66_02090 [Patescibacteria group bacterium]|nr:hypothetical protein [Patescibacteria group bacterium]
MKKLKIATLFLSFCLLPLSAFAQSSFTVSGKALGYLSGGNALVAADAAVTKSFSFLPKGLVTRTDNIVLSASASNSSLAVFDMAGFQYKLPADAVLTKLKLDPTKFDVYATGAFGTDTVAAGVTKAYSGAFGVNYATSSSVTLNLFEVRYLHGPVPIGNNTDGSVHSVMNGVALSVGLTF